MKGSDFIAKFVTEQGSTHSFVLTGGACAHMIDSLARQTGHQVVCVEHEQAGAMAADGFSRNGDGKLGVAIATSGPGATNLITGIACAWFDSVPVVYITGQVNTFEQKGSFKIRQMGFQETEIVEMVSSITKFAKKVDRPEDLKKTLQEAYFLARSGRPGPVLIDVPFNVQTADIDFEITEDFIQPDLKSHKTQLDFSWLDKLKKASRPTLVLGYGVQAAGASSFVDELLKELKIPTVVSWSGLDLVPADHPHYVGQIGVYGARAANFAVQNSDFLLSIGSRLDSRQTGGKYQSFAREAFRVIVDIDEAELNKKRVEPHVPVVSDAKDFIQALTKELKSQSEERRDHKSWIQMTQQWKKELPIYDSSRLEKSVVNPYRFFDQLSDKLEDDAFIIADTGATLTWLIQGLKVKKGQRVISAFGNSPMGYALPAAIGAWFAKKRPVYCVIGDGGFQINIQELQTLVSYQIPVRIFVMNNKGYGIIKQFQDLYLEGRHIATGEGYSCPNFIKIASAYGIHSVSVDNDETIAQSLCYLEEVQGPILFDVNVQPTEKLEPKLGWGRPIEDQLPLLDREQFQKYMLIEPLELSASRGNEIN
ncbi:MAG: thiamine pyrophosphate-binding protein [Bdellovibrionales bacterium]|nr:thiamine pyrophosphate-binding protein [Bdellovibrionales bacterium]